MSIIQLFLSDSMTLYSVMQSDGISFRGDVVLDSFNRAYWDEDTILEQIYKSKYVRIFIMMRFNFMTSLLLCAVFI